ncbi:electron carrier/ protein disulfide oxidoreductase [Anaeramoeba flamelloides]|uniref:Electron carrier/ protein disulfide oxidoreductase n=1 Tax=Anaeramoeba flamelloides TaxID=1746091 RepID=A0AAV8ABM9_9EUKA|nr:electron carrier/ protein disulfide oxidoreductase [Anaeramoeba flamelloides]
MIKKKPSVETLEQTLSALQFRKRRLINYMGEGGELVVKFRTLKSRRNEVLVEKQTYLYQLSQIRVKQQEIQNLLKDGKKNKKKNKNKNIFGKSQKRQNNKNKKNIRSRSKSMLVCSQKEDEVPKNKQVTKLTIKTKKGDQEKKKIQMENGKKDFKLKIKNLDVSLKKESKSKILLKSELKKYRKISQSEKSKFKKFQNQNSSDQDQLKKGLTNELALLTSTYKKKRFSLTYIEHDISTFLQLKDRQRHLHFQIKSRIVENESLRSQVQLLKELLLTSDLSTLSQSSSSFSSLSFSSSSSASELSSSSSSSSSSSLSLVAKDLSDKDTLHINSISNKDHFFQKAKKANSKRKKKNRNKNQNNNKNNQSYEDTIVVNNKSKEMASIFNNNSSKRSASYYNLFSEANLDLGFKTKTKTKTKTDTNKKMEMEMEKEKEKRKKKRKRRRRRRRRRRRKEKKRSQSQIRNQINLKNNSELKLENLTDNSTKVENDNSNSKIEKHKIKNKEQSNKITIDTFESLLRIPLSLDYFTEFLIERMDQENILFFQEVKKFKNNCRTEKQIEKNSKSIFKKYLKIGSQFEINIDSNTRKMIIDKFRDKVFSLSLFDEAHSIVFKHMKFQTYRLFKQSYLYEKLIKKINSDPEFIRNYNPEKKVCQLSYRRSTKKGKQSNTQALNEEYPYLGTTMDALELSFFLIECLINLLNAHYSVSQNKINLKAISRSIAFRKFVQLTNQLQKINFKRLTEIEIEKKCFFLNIYNTLMLHGMILDGFPNSNDEFNKFKSNTRYTINKWKFSLDDIHNGILRSNLDAKHSNKYFKKGDPRAMFTLKKLDPRIHFSLINPWQTSHIKLFSKTNLESALNSITKFILGQCVKVYKKRIDIPSIFEEYEKDFCNTNTNNNNNNSISHKNIQLSILSWISNALDNELDLSFISLQSRKPNSTSTHAHTHNPNSNLTSSSTLHNLTKRKKIASLTSTSFSLLASSSFSLFASSSFSSLSTSNDFNIKFLNKNFYHPTFVFDLKRNISRKFCKLSFLEERKNNH